LRVPAPVDVGLRSEQLPPHVAEILDAEASEPRGYLQASAGRDKWGGGGRARQASAEGPWASLRRAPAFPLALLVAGQLLLEGCRDS
jgi:hypothetical protein